MSNISVKSRKGEPCSGESAQSLYIKHHFVIDIEADFEDATFISSFGAGI